MLWGQLVDAKWWETKTSCANSGARQPTLVSTLVPGSYSLQLVAWCSEIFTQADDHQHPGAIKTFHTALQGVRKIAALPFPCWNYMLHNWQVYGLLCSPAKVLFLAVLCLQGDHPSPFHTHFVLAELTRKRLDLDLKNLYNILAAHIAVGTEFSSSLGPNCIKQECIGSHLQLQLHLVPEYTWH